MNPSEIRFCLSLLRLPGIGTASARALLRFSGAAESVFTMSPERLGAMGLSCETIAAIRVLDGRPDARSQRDLDWILRSQTQVLSIHDPAYPTRLQTIASAPAVLFVQGKAEVLSAPQLAMVGSRRPSPGGRKTARRLAGELSKYGLTITSGLATGIDAESHWGAIEAEGPTVAVAGTGPDVIYPAHHKELAAAILDGGGALVSEFLPGTRPEAHNFPRRNRIISGLSIGVLVVESALQSGSLITARYAAEQNREVMAVPGSVFSPVSSGCHALIKSGAALIENAEDVLLALGDRYGVVRTATTNANSSSLSMPLNLTATEQHVLAAIGYEFTPIDEIIERSGQDAATVGAASVRLEIMGILLSGPGGYTRNPELRLAVSACAE